MPKRSRSRNNSETSVDEGKRSKSTNGEVAQPSTLTTADEITAALKYLKQLARNPTSVSGPTMEKERATILALNRALYEGPTLGQKSKKKAKPTECSPRLFLDHTSISTRLAVGGPSQKHTFGNFEDYLHVVAKCYYTEGNPTHVSKTTTAATDSSSSFSSGSPTSSTTTSTSSSSASSASSADNTKTKGKSVAGAEPVAAGAGAAGAAGAAAATATAAAATPVAPPAASLYLQRETILGKLSHLWRQRSPMDTWAPLEIALFESAICIHGKGKLPSSIMFFFFFLNIFHF